MPEGYNGWSNRATWNVNLWLSNDEGCYQEINRLERRHLTDLKGPVEEAKDAVKDAEEALETAQEDFRTSETGEDTEAAELNRRDAREDLEAAKAALAKAEAELAEGPDDYDLGKFAKAIEEFCRELWPSNETPDGDALANADFEEIAKAWAED